VRDGSFVLRVTERESLTDEVVALTLTDPDGGPLPAWSPGAHIDLVLGSDLVRQYSLCSDPADSSSWRIAVLRAPESRGGSSHVHDELAAGDLVTVRGPRNHFELHASPKYVFIAGGIGITPILPMIEAVNATGADWRLAYGGRSRDSMAFAHELAGSHAARVVLYPQDEAGIIPLADVLGAPDEEVLVYCCGPAPLLAACERACAGLGRDALHIERFGPREGDPEVTDEEFEVELASSGTVLKVPAGRSLLSVLLDAGADIDYSCQEGTCGTCETGVLAGVPDHRDSVLNESERAAGTCMFVCVSRARSSRLVLDL
jgi:ferredoxin-NADP reductase